MKNYLSPAPEVVVAPTQSFPLGPGPYSPPGDYPYYVACGDIDGDGRDEIVLFNSSVPTLGLLSYFEYGDISSAWTNQTQGQLVNLWSCTNSVPNGWVLHGNDMYFTADVDGDGSDEIISVYSVSGVNPVGAAMGVSKFQNASLTTLWNDYPPYLYSTLSLYQYYVADVDGDGCEEIVCVSPRDTNVIILKWVNSTLQAFLEPMYWPITLSDQIFVAKLSASNGDPRDHLVVFNPTTLTLQAWLWNPVNKQLTGFTAATNTIPAPTPAQGPTPAGWTLSANDQFTVADVTGNGSDALVVYNATSQKLGVVEWDIPNSVFNASWTGGNVVPGNFQSSTTTFFPAKVSGQAGEQILVYNQSSGAPGQTFMGLLKCNGSTSALTGSSVAAQAALPSYVSDSALMYAQDIDGDGNTELVFVNSGTQSIGMLKWDGTTLSSQWSTQNTVQGYSVDLIMAGPKTPFITFTGNQLLIYQHISNQLDPNCNANIRGEYNSPNYPLADNFGELALQLLNMPQWLPTGSTSEDWARVEQPLYNELYAVDAVTKWRTSHHHLNSKLKDASDAAMGNAWSDVTQAATNGNESVSYIVEDVLNAVFDAAMWGVAGLSLEDGGPSWNSMQIGLAVGASLYGSYTSSVPGGGATTPQTIDYPHFQAAIDQQYLNIDSQVDTSFDIILADEVMLPLFGKLVSAVNNPWTWLDSEADTIGLKAIAPYTVHYYTIFIPMRFNMFELWGTNANEPYCCVEEGNSQVGYFWRRVWLSPPSYTMWSQNNGNGTWDYSIVAYGTPTSLTYPAQQLLTNMTSFGIPLPSFFQCQGVWNAMPVVGLGGDC